MKEEKKYRVMAGVVCYNPEIYTFEKNLKSIVSQADETLIVDNNSANSRDIDKLVSGFNKLGNKRVSILHNPDNYGVSKALNQIMQIAYDGEFEWVLTMDQDTELPEGYIKKNLELIINLQDHRIAVVNGQYVEKGRDHRCNQRKKSFSDTDHVITSGSIVSADKWKNVGGFDEKLFIDFVDTYKDEIEFENAPKAKTEDTVMNWAAFRISEKCAGQRDISSESMISHPFAEIRR